MSNDYLIAIPLVTALSIDIIYPFLFYISCPDVWFAPSQIFCTLVYLAICVLIGFTMKDAKRIENNDILAFSIALLVFNLIWPIALKRYYKISLILLFITLLSAYFVYNEIFLSRLTDGENTNYLNLYSTLIIWLGFMITMVFEKGSKFYKNSIVV